MKRTVLSIAIAAALQAMSGCTIVPAATAAKACSLLDTASQEADLAGGWYLQAGELLERCGVQGAREAATVRACYADSRSGYRSSKECEAPQ